MKSTTRLLAMALAVGVCGGCSERRDWAFMEGVGGMRVGAPYRVSGTVFLPVDCDVSGLHAIANGPRQVNSGVAVQRVRARVVGRAVFLQVSTTMGGHGRTSRCGPVELAVSGLGKYKVFYGAPPGLFGPRGGAHEIGEIVLEPEDASRPAH